VAVNRVASAADRDIVASWYFAGFSRAKDSSITKPIGRPDLVLGGQLGLSRLLVVAMVESGFASGKVNFSVVGDGAKTFNSFT